MDNGKGSIIARSHGIDANCHDHFGKPNRHGAHRNQNKRQRDAYLQASRGNEVMTRGDLNSQSFTLNKNALLI